MKNLFNSWLISKFELEYDRGREIEIASLVSQAIKEKIAIIESRFKEVLDGSFFQLESSGYNHKISNDGYILGVFNYCPLGDCGKGEITLRIPLNNRDLNIRAVSMFNGTPMYFPVKSPNCPVKCKFEELKYLSNTFYEELGFFNFKYNGVDLSFESVFKPVRFEPIIDPRIPADSIFWIELKLIA